jgi:hypothetical protein
MKWTQPHDLRAQVQKLWDRGELLASLVTGEPLFPKRLALKTPTSAEISDRFEEVRAWIGEIREFPKGRLEMRDFRHRLFGANSIPQAVWIDTVEEALLLIGKSRAAGRFSELISVTRELEPRLLSWLAKRPLRALELDDEWRRLLEIVAWIEKNPAPGVYLRQVDIPGVHTKFIETHRGVLAELLDIVLSPEAIDSTASGTSKFAKRYGFRDKPDRIRFRVLDPQCAILSCGLGQDITLDAESFALLDPKVSRVFITENEINFLAFPQAKESLVIFGSGYGFEMLSKAEWLKRCRIYYWGDIDTHGYAILDQLRSCFDNVESFLMDHATLLAFESQWGKEEKQTLRDLPRLTGEEKALFDDLRDNRIRGNLRLEQERVGFGWVESALSVLFKSGDLWK